MNELTIFKDSEFGEIRTVVEGGEPMFCLSDVCRALELTQASKVRDRLSEKGVLTIPTLTNGGKQNLLYVNEANLYKVIFQSRKESAERFTDWVSSEVLPSIRKNGGYIAGQEQMSEKELLARALMVAQKTIERREFAIKQLESDIEVMKPKADFFDTVADSKTAISMNEVAKVIGINGMGRNNLFEFLRNNEVLQKNNVPYQKYVDSGWFRVVEQSFQKNGEPVVTTKTLVYQKGVDGIRQLLEKKGIS